MTDLVIGVDTREQKPLPFPTTLSVLASATPPRVRRVMVHTRPLTLTAADYIHGFEPANIYFAGSAGVVERKHSLEEITTNCLNPQRRPAFIRCLDAMSDAWPHPVLLLETNKGRMSPSAHGQSYALDALIDLCLPRRIHIHYMHARTIDDRRFVAEWVARLLFYGATQWPRPSPPPPSPPTTPSSPSAPPTPSSSSSTPTPSPPTPTPTTPPK